MLIPFSSKTEVAGRWRTQGLGGKYDLEPRGGSVEIFHPTVGPDLVSAIAPLPLSCSKKESAYSDRWTHKKNVTMDKQNVNTTASMKGKGDSSSSHYRISSGLESVYWGMVSVEEKEKKKKKKKKKEKARYT